MLAFLHVRAHCAALVGLRLWRLSRLVALRDGRNAATDAGGEAMRGREKADPPLPDAAPRSDRPRCGGRESKFLGGATFRPGRSEAVQNLKREAEGEVKRAEVFAGAAVGVHAVVEAEGADGEFVAEAEAEAVAEVAGAGHVAI